MGYIHRVAKRHDWSDLACAYIYKIKAVKPKGNELWIFIQYSLESLMLKLKLQYFGHLMLIVDSLKKVLVLGKTESKRRRGGRGWDDWIASLTQWAWISKLQDTVKDSEAWEWCRCCSPWSWTFLSNWLTVLAVAPLVFFLGAICNFPVHGMQFPTCFLSLNFQTFSISHDRCLCLGHKNVL